MVVNTLRRLKVKAIGDLVFGIGNNEPENHSNIVQRIFHRAQVAAGVVDRSGAPKYSAYIHSGISLQAGCSTAARMVDSVCRSRKRRSGSGTPPWR
jgi:hypothetical protein